MFVWHNECCPGISPKSCSKPSLHSWERSRSNVLPGAERGGHTALVSRCTAGSAGGWAVREIGDQSLAWCRLSIAQRLSVFSFLLCAVQVCLSLHVGARRCVSRLLLDEKKKKKKWEVFSALKVKPIKVSQVDSLQGQLTCCRLQLNSAI